MLTGFVQF